MDVKQFTELTGTNRSCGLTISLRQTSKAKGESPKCSHPGFGSRHLAHSAKDNNNYDPKISGGDIEEATPDPIPNSEVKLFGADGTAREAVWESRTLPGLFPESPNAFAFGLSSFVRSVLGVC